MTSIPTGLQSKLDGKKFLVVAWTRGDWCPFSRAWASSLDALRSEIETMGGALVGVTSQRGFSAEEWSQPSDLGDVSFEVLQDDGNRMTKEAGVVIQSPDKARASEYPYLMAQV